jgi:hypothetical protein
MRKRVLRRPSPGTVLGSLALIIAIAGNTGAFAGTTHPIVRKGDIAKGAVTASTLAKGAVKTKALARGAVDSRSLASGAVNSAALAPGAVGAGALAKSAIGPNALAPDAVTASALAPNSVYGGALGPIDVHSAPIADLDEVEENGTWTTSNAESAVCGTGERLLTGGVVFTNPGNREVAIVRSLPISNASFQGYSGQITSNSGGSAAAEVQAICLR